MPTQETGEGLETLPLEDLRTMVRQEGARVKELGEWHPAVDTEKSLVARIPETEETQAAPGFDAGLACTLDLIPRDKQKLAAMMHANINPPAIQQIRSEIQSWDPDSETVWWLAACNVCDEGNIDGEKFRGQLTVFQELAADPEKRLAAAKAEYQKMTQSVDTTQFGIPFGTVDGCMHGAYISGYPIAGMYAPEYGIFFIGTFDTPINNALADFPWKNPDQEGQRGTSGMIAPQFFKCADEDEFRKVIAHLQTKAPQLFNIQ